MKNTILRWLGRTSGKAFADRMLPHLQAAIPQARFERTDDLGFSCPTRDDSGTLQINLDNAYQEFLADPKSFDEIAARYCDGTARTFAGPPPFDPSQLVPMIKARDWFQTAYGTEVVNTTWQEDLNEALTIVYAQHDDGFRFLHRKLFDNGDYSETALAARAIENLSARTAQFEWVGSGTLRLASTGGNFESALILRDDLVDRLPGGRDKRWLIGVPDRNSLAVALHDDPQSVFDLANGTLRLYRSEAHSISHHVFCWHQGRITLLDSLQDDNDHPIPSIDVIDVFAVRKGGGASLSVIIATPLDASPRSIYRLTRKLAAHLIHLGSDAHRTECGRPEPGNTNIAVKIHPKSDPAVFELLNTLQGWVGQHGARLTVDKLATDDSPSRAN